jgi:hypothetical protein
LLGLVDANYKFIAEDVAAYDRNSHQNIFAKSTLVKLLERGSLRIPTDKPLRENGEPLPHVMVDDEAFPLKPYLLQPYSRKTIRGNKAKNIFNYRLSSAKRVLSRKLIWNLAAR